MWWRSDANLRRFIVDLLQGFLSTSRSGGSIPAAQSILLADNWLQPPIAMDSLELLDCATQFSQRLHIHETGLEDLLLIQPSVKSWKAVAMQSLEKSHESLSFFSSGSIGQAQRHRLPVAHLQQEITFITRQLIAQTLSTQRRIWALVPAHHVYGFIFTLLLPAALPDQPEVLDGRQRMLSALGREFRQDDIVVAIPDFWRQWLESGETLPAGITAVVSAAPCEDFILQGLSAQGAQTLEIYGATESAGIGFRRHANEAFSLMPYWQVEGEEIVNPVHRARIPDHLSWQDAQHFLPIGRRDGQVQIAGRNVDLLKIAALICEHPKIKESAVRLHQQHLKAFLVPYDLQARDEALIDEIAVWLAEQLPTLYIPKHFKIGQQLPRNAMGKLCDWLP